MKKVNFHSEVKPGQEIFLFRKFDSEIVKAEVIYLTTQPNGSYLLSATLYDPRVEREDVISVLLCDYFNLPPDVKIAVDDHCGYCFASFDYQSIKDYACRYIQKKIFEARVELKTLVKTLDKLESL